MMPSCLFGTGRYPASPAGSRRQTWQGPDTPFHAVAPPGAGLPQPARTPAQAAGSPGLGQSGCQGQAGQVGAAAAAGLVPDPVQVRADGADADVQLGGDLGIGAAPGDQGNQLLFPGAERL